MLNPEKSTSLVQTLVDKAVKAGATSADALCISSRTREVSVRLGQLEDVQSSDGGEIGLRVFVGQRNGSVSSSDLTEKSFDTLVDRALAMAKLAPEDKYAGLAPQDMLATDYPTDLGVSDGQDPDPALLKSMALEAEDAARAVKGVTNSEGGGASAGASSVALATSHGFAGGYSGTSYGVSASVLAGTGSAMQRDYAYRSVRHLKNLPGAAEIGTEAGERAVARLNPVRAKGGAMTIVFHPRVGGSLLGHLLSAISGPSIARRTSFLLDALDTQLFDSSVRVVDDPLRHAGLRSKPFDGEGLPTAKRHLVEDGRLTGWIMESASARQLGLVPTGHAVRGVGGPPSVSATNLHLEPGDASPDDLMVDIGTGIFVTELIGMGVNPVTGDYSRGASGFMIRDGKVAEPVSEFTVAGNLKDMFAALIPANDLEWLHGINVPTIRVDGMTVAGD